MKHLLNNLSNEEKNSIREQHTGGMKVITENFYKLLNSKLGDVKPLVSEQSTNVAKNVGVSTATGAALGSVVPVAGTLVGGVVGALIGSANAIANGTGTSDQKVKQFCDLCKKSKAQITQKSNQLADMVRDAVQGVGTTEDNIYKAFNNLASFDEFCSLVKAYQQSYSSDLYVDLDDDIDSEGEWVQIMRPIRDVILRQKSSTTTTKTTRGTQNPMGAAVAKPTRPTPRTVSTAQPTAQPTPRTGSTAQPRPTSSPEI